ncbi:putative short-chain dehydrogenase/reductase family 42E member 2 [Pseudocercospora fuligena]|uniref:Putative short-chain dehydrogenase/reductase family 42E member 2 n=1 Tax=Pseudocercospora fuligena TaxID=685502 RepID=A0A8H6RNS7_9PEZI|nr:putative short-chain dehydrogenase/reductase family 42E member 2 [Pseudocercospora fuligena]
MADTNSETPNANLDPSIDNPAAAPAGNDESTANNITAQPVVQPEHADAGQQQADAGAVAGAEQVTNAGDESKPAEQEQQPQLPAEPDTRPAVLIIGGLGFIGRFLASYIHKNKLASTLRLVDKQLPQLASLAPEHQEACSNDNFVQADASREQSQSRVFDLPAGPDGAKREFDYVFNCGGETRFSQEDEVYKLRSYQLSLSVGKEAARRGVKAFVECSTGTVYNPNKTPQKETEKTSKPHTKQAKWKLAAEEELSKIAGLKLVVLRFPNVYGPYGGRGWLGTQLALARVYQSREPKDTMKWLWSGDLRTNTLHVEDAARACWLAAEWRSKNDSIPNVSSDAIVFNVVDKGETKQRTMADIIKELFGIETGFQNAFVNTFARLNLEHVVDDLNDDTLDDWADLQEAAGITDKGGPLSPFMEKEILRDADLSIDGSRFETVVGFRPQHERITKEEVQAVIESYKSMGWWP